MTSACCAIRREEASGVIAELITVGRIRYGVMRMRAVIDVQRVYIDTCAERTTRVLGEVGGARW